MAHAALRETFRYRDVQQNMKILHDDDHGTVKVASRTSLPHLDLELSVTLKIRGNSVVVTAV
jgi:hypothetical protein